MNEELRSATEELETSREELQSINEELTTVNSELKSRVDELGHANSDLQNLITTSAIATVFLDRNLHITRFTPLAIDIFHLIPSDVGRPLSDLHHRLLYPELQSDAEQALRSLASIERVVHEPNGGVFLGRALPYRTVEDRIEGVVLTFLDVTELKRAESELADSREQLRLVAENARDYAIFSTDLEWRVTSWNSGAERLLGYKESEIIGMNVEVILAPEDRHSDAGRSWRRLRWKKVGQWMSDGAYERTVSGFGVAVWSWLCALTKGKSSASASYFATKPRFAQPWMPWPVVGMKLRRPRAKNHFLAASLTNSARRLLRFCC